ncbi:MAG: outer membrane beta-barrel protein [Chitinophagaceae bacterium]
MKTGGLMPNDLEQFAGGELKKWSLQPDAAVWDAVAERIRKERRRRIIFWWTSAAAIFMLIAGIWVLLQDRDKTEFAKLNHTKRQTEQATEKDNQTNKPASNKAISYPPDEVSVQQAEIKSVATKPRRAPAVNTVVKKQGLASKLNISQPQIQQTDSKPEPSLVANQTDALHSNNTQQEFTVVAKETELKKEENVHNVIDDKEDAVVKQELVSDKTDTISISSKDSTKQKKNTRKKPSWYFTAQAGFSDIRPSELFSLAVAQDMQFNGGSSPVIGAGNLSGTVFTPGDLQYKAGFSFSLDAGITILQKKYWQFSAGLQYRYASMQLATGARVDTVFQARESRTNAATAVTAFYRPGNGFTYQHQFHLLQMPMVFHIQPFGMKKWRLDAGLLPGVLLGAKALHYNEGNNIFYTSNQQYQRLLLNASIGVQYAIPIQKGKKLWVGPQLELGLRNMHQPELSRKAFFQSANITFTIQ